MGSCQHHSATLYDKSNRAVGTVTHDDASDSWSFQCADCPTGIENLRTQLDAFDFGCIHRETH